jgi:hypothetical protein
MDGIFNQITTVISNNSYAFFGIGAVIVITIVFSIVRLNKMKSNNQKFLSEHPDAAKIYLTSKALITAEAVTVHLVGDGAPVFFAEGAKSGFYTVPGKNLVTMSYTHSRPGVMYKTVTHTYGPEKRELITEANKVYKLSFNRDSEEFLFDEIG